MFKRNVKMFVSMFNIKARNNGRNKWFKERASNRKKELKKCLKRRSIDSRWTKEKSSFNLRDISKVMIDSAEIIPVIK